MIDFFKPIENLWNKKTKPQAEPDPEAWLMRDEKTPITQLALQVFKEEQAKKPKEKTHRLKETLKEIFPKPCKHEWTKLGGPYRVGNQFEQKIKCKNCGQTGFITR